MNPSPASSVPDHAEFNPVNATVATIRGIVGHWEKRRLVYNAILLVPGLLLIGRVYSLSGPARFGPVMTTFGIVTWVAIFAVMANICFTMAPYLEFLLVARGYGVTGARIRPFLFAIALLLSGFGMFVVWLVLDGVGLHAFLP